MGDQKYLDNIYKKFKNKIYISDNDFFRSTWNYKKIKFDKIIAWHFHGFKIIKKKLLLMHHLEYLPSKIIKKIYNPYIKSIDKNIKKIRFNKTQFNLDYKNLINIIKKIKLSMIQLKILETKKYYVLN